VTTEPQGPTRYVTPADFNVGQNYIGGCPKCEGTGEMGVWAKWACWFCKGWGTALYTKQPDGTFKPQRVPREPI
jgi:hypothetical protein